MICWSFRFCITSFSVFLRGASHHIELYWFFWNHWCSMWEKMTQTDYEEVPKSKKQNKTNQDVEGINLRTERYKLKKKLTSFRNSTYEDYAIQWWGKWWNVCFLQDIGNLKNVTRLFLMNLQTSLSYEDSLALLVPIRHQALCFNSCLGCVHSDKLLFVII